MSSSAPKAGHRSPSAAHREPIEVSSVGVVERLAREILSRDRRQPIVCVTVPGWARTALVDVEALTEGLGDAATIYLLRSGELCWELANRLPPRLDVYGGAIRVWPPPNDEGHLSPEHSPLFIVHGRNASKDTIEKVLVWFVRTGWLDLDLPDEGAELAAVVVDVMSYGAELALTGGYPAFARRADISSPRLSPERVLRRGQALRVRVKGTISDSGMIPVSLIELMPDPWERLLSQCDVGDVVEGIVELLRNFGAFVTLLPGVEGLLHKSKISKEWTSHPEDRLTVGERIVVRIVDIDKDARRIELSCRGLSDRGRVDCRLSLLPDGPPWLPPVEQEAAEGALAEATLEEDEAKADEDEAKPPEAPRGEPQLDGLERVIAEGNELCDEVGTLLGDAKKRLLELRSEASRIADQLKRDIAEARLRVLELAESESSELVGSTEAALAAAREEAKELRERLAAAEGERSEALQRMQREHQRAEAAEQRSGQLGREVKTAEGESERLQRALDAAGVDAARQLAGEIEAAYRRTTTPHDRRRHRWQEPLIGPDLLNSIENVQGIGRSRIIEVCAHVACGRAPEVAGLDPRPLLRTKGASQLERDDGARAWRCSLQVGTPSARRLHYWLLPGGQVELAKVVYHDDFSIR